MAQMSSLRLPEIYELWNQERYRLSLVSPIFPRKASNATLRNSPPKHPGFTENATSAFRIMFNLYKRKFAVSEISFALRGLTYFDDAEDDPMPKMFAPIKWNEVKAKICEAVRNFVKFA